jgi:hypothetical protein
MLPALWVLLVALAATRADEGAPSRDDPSAAVQEGVCAEKSSEEACPDPYTFANSEARQDPGVQNRTRMLQRLDASSTVPAFLHVVYEGLFENTLEWLEALENQDDPPLLGWSSEALQFMDQALQDDPLSAFEVLFRPTPGPVAERPEGDGPFFIPAPAQTFLVKAPGFRSEASADLESRPPALKGGRRRLSVVPSANDGSAVAADSAHRPAARIHPSERQPIWTQ